MISELVKGLRKLGNQWKHNDVAGCNLIFDAADTIEILSTKLSKHNLGYGEWVPCSERLPNTNGIYIVTRRRSDGFEYRNITDACYFDGSSTWHDDTRVNHERKYLHEVLAWMPLPEPYKGSDSE